MLLHDLSFIALPHPFISCSVLTACGLFFFYLLMCSSGQFADSYFFHPPSYLLILSLLIWCLWDSTLWRYSVQVWPGGDSEVDPGLGGKVIYTIYPGNVFGSVKMSWEVFMGRGTSRTLGLACCHLNLEVIVGWWLVEFDLFEFLHLSMRNEEIMKLVNENQS